MTLLRVRTIPDSILRIPAVPVEIFDAKLQSFIDDMWETMYASNGIGLAAPQVGVSQRVVVIDLAEEHSQKLVLVNPKILQKTGKIRSEEGCLSIPEFRETIQRISEIKISAQNAQGETIELLADGLLSRCIQHEIDHLDGILFVDHLSRLKRELFRRWLAQNPQFNESSPA